jgi:caspase domain-containing protein
VPRYPDAKLSRVVLIGTSDFELPDKLPNLPGVRGNLSGLERALTDPSRGVFDESSCVVIDSPDTARSLISRLSRAAEQAEDVLVVYYAGHGTLDANGALHLAVRETDPGPYQVGATAVPFTMLRQVIENSPARLRILVLDCCFSGRAVGAMAADTAALGQIDASGTYVLTSTEANRISVAVEGERYTAFTRVLLGLLTDHADSSELTLDELQTKLRAGLARAGMPRPMSRADDTAGRLVVRRGGQPVHDRRQPLPKPTPKPIPKPIPKDRLESFARPQAKVATGPLVKPVRSTLDVPSAQAPTTPAPSGPAVGWQRLVRVVSEPAQWVLVVFCAAMTATGITQTVSPPANSTTGPALDIVLVLIFAGLTVWLGWRLIRIRRQKRAARRTESS